MSGSNRLIVSEDTMEGESYEQIATDLLNANEAAAEESSESASEEANEKEE